MTLLQLPQELMPEINPYQPTVPDSIRAVSSDLYDFLRDMTETVRTQHNRSQMGDSTYHWQAMLAIDSEPKAKPGSLGTFYHPDYGSIRARYVQFSNLDAAKPVGSPVGRLMGLRGLPWRATNDESQMLSGGLLGLAASFDAPTQDSFGWIITEGVNLSALRLMEKPAVGQAIMLNDSLLGRFIGGTMDQVDGKWLIPAGAVLVGCEQVAPAKDSGLVTSDSLGYGTQIAEIRKYLELLDGRDKLSIEILSRRVTTLTKDRANIQLIEQLNAAANFSRLAGVAASNAGFASRLTNVNLNASQQILREVEVYRTDAGYYARSATEFSNTAALSANDSLVNAEASALHSQEAGVQADAAGVSAYAAEQSKLAAGVSAGDATTQAGLSEQSRVYADQAAAEATRQATLSAGYSRGAKGLTANPDFLQGKVGWEFIEGSWDFPTIATGRTVPTSKAGVNARVYGPMIAINGSSKYRIHADWQNFGPALLTYIGFECYDSTGRHLGNTYSFYSPTNSQQHVGTFSGFTDPTPGQQFTTVGKLIGGTTQIRLIGFFNYDSIGGAYAQLGSLWAEDVTAALLVDARVTDVVRAYTDADTAIYQAIQQVRLDYANADTVVSQSIDNKINASVTAGGVVYTALQSIRQDFANADTQVSQSIDTKINATLSPGGATYEAINSITQFVNGFDNRITQTFNLATDASGRATVYWAVTSDLGGQRAGLELRHSTGQYATFDITANVRIYGNLLVTGTVNTLQMALNSTSALAAGFVAGGSVSDGQPVQTDSFVFASTGSPLVIDVQFDSVRNVNGTGILKGTLYESSPGGTFALKSIQMRNPANNTGGPGAFWWLSTPPAGNVSYYMLFEMINGGGSTLGGFSVTNVGFRILEVKR